MTIWHMRISRWVPQATNTHTHSYYMVLSAFPPQHWLHDAPHCYVPSYALGLSLLQLTTYEFYYEGDHVMEYEMGWSDSRCEMIRTVYRML
jgi:hypothetical protein